MNVGTADLKNNLSRYLRQIRCTGESIIVFDRDEPVAMLSPLACNAVAEWQRYRAEALARADEIGLKISLPLRRPTGAGKVRAQPVVAPDGRTDIHSIDLVRAGRDY